MRAPAQRLLDRRGGELRLGHDARARRPRRRAPRPRWREACARASSSYVDVVAEQEAEQPGRLAEQLHALLHERSGASISACCAGVGGLRRRRPAPCEVRHDARGEVRGLQHPDVVAVDRLGLLLVEARRVRVDVDDVERGDQLVEREDVAVGRDRPAEQRQVVEQALGDEARARAAGRDSASGSRLESFLLPLAEDERHVREARDERRHAGVDERAGTARAGAAVDGMRSSPRMHVGDAHERVVDRVDEACRAARRRRARRTKSGNEPAGKVTSPRIEVDEA